MFLVQRNTDNSIRNPLHMKNTQGAFNGPEAAVRKKNQGRRLLKSKA